MQVRLESQRRSAAVERLMNGTQEGAMILS